jgi:hypothetical protein
LQGWSFRNGWTSPAQLPESLSRLLILKAESDAMVMSRLADVLFGSRHRVSVAKLNLRMSHAYLSQKIFI